MTGRRSTPWTDPLGLVGWVFADLLLGLAIVFLATQPGNPSAGRNTGTTVAPTTTAPDVTTTTVAAGVDRQYLCFRVFTNPQLLVSPPSPERDQHITQLADQVRSALDGLDSRKRRAGIVISFGRATTPGEGRDIAQVFNDSVLPEIPGVFGRSASRAFWDGQPIAEAPYGSVGVNVYPITSGDSEPLPPAQDC